MTSMFRSVLIHSHLPCPSAKTLRAKICHNNKSQAPRLATHHPNHRHQLHPSSHHKPTTAKQPCRPPASTTATITTIPSTRATTNPTPTTGHLSASSSALAPFFFSNSFSHSRGSASTICAARRAGAVCGSAASLLCPGRLWCIWIVCRRDEGSHMSI
jgi:hypothetical protein